MTSQDDSDAYFRLVRRSEAGPSWRAFAKLCMLLPHPMQCKSVAWLWSNYLAQSVETLAKAAALVMMACKTYLGARAMHVRQYSLRATAGRPTPLWVVSCGNGFSLHHGTQRRSSSASFKMWYLSRCWNHSRSAPSACPGNGSVSE